MASRQSLEFKDKIRVLKFLENVATKKVVDGDNYAIYENGWNDDRVLDELKRAVPNINKGHVQAIRRDGIGELPRALQGGRPSPIWHQRVTALEARLATLEAWASNLDGQFKPALPHANGEVISQEEWDAGLLTRTGYGGNPVPA